MHIAQNFIFDSIILKFISVTWNVCSNYFMLCVITVSRIQIIMNTNLIEKQLLIKFHYICSELGIFRDHELCKGCEGGNLVKIKSQKRRHGHKLKCSKKNYFQKCCTRYWYTGFVFNNTSFNKY